MEREPGLRFRGDLQQAQVLGFLLEDFERLGLVVRRGDNLVEHGPHRLCRLGGERRVETDYPAVRRDGVAGEGAPVRLGLVVVHRQAACVGVFDDRDGRGRQHGNGRPRSVSIKVVDVRHRPSVEQLGGGDAAAVPAVTRVECAGLVRVLSIAEDAAELEASRELVREKL